MSATLTLSGVSITPETALAKFSASVGIVVMPTTGRMTRTASNTPSGINVKQARSSRSIGGRARFSKPNRKRKSR